LPEPIQVQDQLNGLVTVEGVPKEQRLTLGVVAVANPLAEPQYPFTGVFGFGAEQLTVVPSPEPTQVQVHGPVPETEDAVPVRQRFALGTDTIVTPLAAPQTPFTTTVHACVVSGLPVVTPQ
jgi:hypothetical protein